MNSNYKYKNFIVTYILRTWRSWNFQYDQRNNADHCKYHKYFGRHSFRTSNTLLLLSSGFDLFLTTYKINEVLYKVSYTQVLFLTSIKLCIYYAKDCSEISDGERINKSHLHNLITWPMRLVNSFSAQDLKNG